MLFSLIVANIKIIVRDRQALFWALFFPLIFVMVFGLFKLDEPGQTTIAVVDEAKDPVSQAFISNLGSIELLNLEQDRNEQEARDALKSGTVSFVLLIPRGLAEKVGQSASPVPLTIIYDESQMQSNQIMLGVIRQFVDQTNMALQQAKPLIELQPQGIQTRNVRYFDFLLPGFVGMGVMMYSLMGMASVVALYRQKKIFKRILTTPLKVRSFFVAQIIAYLLLSLVQAAIILAAGVLLFNGHIYGNVFGMFVLVICANIIFLNLGFIIGALAKRVEAANGFANAVAIPMMFFSGTFFGTENLPGIMPDIVKYLPLTPLISAMRGISVEAQPFWAYPSELAILGIWIMVTSALALKVFKFE